MDPVRVQRIRDLASAFINGLFQGRQEAGEIEYLLDEEFPDDDEMQDFVSDLSRYSPGGGEHLLDEAGAAQVCRGILRRLTELGFSPARP